MPSKKELDKLIAQKDAFIENAIKDLDAKAGQLQKRLFDELFEKLIVQLDAVGGSLTRENNFTKINNLDKLMDDFAKQFGDKLVKGIADDMLKTIDFTDEYYKTGINVSERTFEAMKQNTQWIYDRIGIDRQGEIIKGSFLDNLAKMPEVRTKLREYITNNVINKAGITEFQKGFKDLVMGTKDVPGVVKSFHATYSFDKYNQVDNAVNNVYAVAMGLDYFIYSGTVMERTRCFCRHRANKIFSIKDTEKWKDDTNLISYYETHDYNPLIDMGGFNCRHRPLYIDKRTAESMGYSKAFADSIIDMPCD